jgi:hypothetical protein
MSPRITFATREERLARYEKLKQAGILRVLGFGLSLGVMGIIFERISRKTEALPWYAILGLCLVAGLFWGLAMWFVLMRNYRALQAE